MTFHLDTTLRKPKAAPELNHMAQSPVTVTLPIPPSTNGLYANIPRRGRVRSERYRSWSNAAGWELKRQRPGKVMGHVAISIEVERSSERRQDVSNRIKAVEDLAVEHGLIEDDSLVTRVEAEWVDNVTGCRITIRPSEPRFKRRRD